MLQRKHTVLDKMTPESTERFWSKVDVRSEDECWPWQGEMGPEGYGRMKVWNDGEKTRLAAHAVAKTLELGEEIPRDKVLAHMCDNPPCCNPGHLVVATHQGNMNDMVERNRAAVSFGRAKLDWEDVESIRGSTLSGKALAHNYDVSKGTISDIRNNKIWKEEHQHVAFLPS